MSNIQPYIIINGVNSRTISGLLITSLPPISKPQQRTQVETVDGRSGDIITPLGFSAYDKTVSIGLTYNYDIDEIIEFFNTSGTVIFSNEPTKYYRFAIYEQIDFERLIRFKTAEVVLHVQPYKFSTTEEPLLFNDPTDISVKNNGNTDARPNLLITGSGEIDVSLNGSQLLSLDLGEDDQTVIIDSENMNAYGAQSAIREVVADIEPKQAGSGDPSPDNIREISDYSELNLTRCGKNLLNTASYEDGQALGIYLDALVKYADASKCSVVKLPLKAGTYTLSHNGVYSDVVYACYYYDNNEAHYINNAQLPYTFTLPTDAYVGITFPTMSQSDVGQFMLNIGSTATEYEAYNGLIKNIAFTDGDDPLTVYGGKLNVTTGLIEVTYKKITRTWGQFGYKESTGNFTRGVILITSEGMGKNHNLNDFCNVAKCSYDYSDSDHFFIETDGVNTAVFIWLPNDAIDSLSIEIVYELADPITYQLTPTQINNLLGLNNLYSDTGDLSVKYKSGGVIQTQTGDIVTFTVGVGDMDKGTLLNRLITGDYDKIRLKKGENTLSFTGNALQLVIDKYSRWI